jgi:hypothetical protein
MPSELEGIRYFTEDEISDLLKKARDLGFSLDEGSELESLTVRELEILVTTVQ